MSRSPWRRQLPPPIPSRSFRRRERAPTCSIRSPSQRPIGAAKRNQIPRMGRTASARPATTSFSPVAPSTSMKRKTHPSASSPRPSSRRTPVLPCAAARQRVAACAHPFFQYPKPGLAVEEVVAADPAAGGGSHGSRSPNSTKRMSTPLLTTVPLTARAPGQGIEFARKCVKRGSACALAHAPSTALSYGKYVQDAVPAVGFMSELHPGDRAWRDAWNDLDFRRQIYHEMARCNAPETAWRRVLGVLNRTYSDDTIGAKEQGAAGDCDPDVYVRFVAGKLTGRQAMTRGVPVLDPKIHLKGATPETLAAALLRNPLRPRTRRKAVVRDQVATPDDTNLPVETSERKSRRCPER